MFKIGDKVRIIGDSCMHLYPLNAELFITGGSNDYWRLSNYANYVRNCDIVLINNNKELNMKEKFITMFLSEPEKSFRKAGITNGDGLLTDDGQKVFLTWLLKKQGDTFKVEVVDELLKDEDKK